MQGKESIMATIINNPDRSDNAGGVGVLVGLLAIIILAVLFFVYGLPALRHSSAPQNSATVNVPDKVDVNVNK
jgi:hypothetical protein